MSKNIFKQKNLYYFLIPFVFFCIFSLISITLAWTEPTSAPPGGNVSAPINVGNVTQTKSGGLNILGKVKIGETSSLWVNPNLHIKGSGTSNADLTLQKGGKNPNNYYNEYPVFSFEASGDALYLSTKVPIPNTVSFGNSTITLPSFETTNLLVVKNNGNVGIGTSEPSAKLDVNGQIKIRGGNPGLNKVLASNAEGLASWKSLSEILSASDISNIFSTTNITQLTVGKICLGSNNSCIENWNDIISQIGTNYWTLSGNNLYPTSTNYNVGIGIINPTAKLHISDTNTSGRRSSLLIQNTGNAILTLYRTVNNDDSDINFNLGATAAKFYISKNYDVNDLLFTILSNGNVGIGTNNPSQKLEVSGNILVKGLNNFNANDNSAYLYLGDTNHYIRSVWGKGVYIGTYAHSDIFYVNQNTGNIEVSGLCLNGDCKKSWPTGGSKTERIICTYSENYFTYFDKNSGTLEIENQCKIKRDTESKDNKNYILGCPSGYRIVSGGPWCDGNKFIRESRPDSEISWKVSCRDISGKTTPNGATIICEK